jgi:bifunctional UDP-N-acetylglucosamine pyrophosphorylase/glucosamine-1-phosphate N-acetyltransferase
VFIVENLNNWIGIVLGAGHGKRMKSNLPKIAHVLHDRPMVIWVLQSLIKAEIKKIILVISSDHKEQIAQIIQDAKFDSQVQICFSYQDTPLGTGHAVSCGIHGIQEHFLDSLDNSKKEKLNILVAYGDTPAVQADTFKKFIQFHEQEKNIFTILAFKAKSPFGYGRIITDQQGDFLAIREEKDCNEEEKKLDLCNSGLLCGKLMKFTELLPQLENKNSQGEYYLTDVSILAKKSGYKVGVMVGNDEHEFLGVNSQEQLLELEKSICAE